MYQKVPSLNVWRCGRGGQVPSLCPIRLAPLGWTAHPGCEGCHSQCSCREAGGLFQMAGVPRVCINDFGKYVGSTHQEMHRCSYSFIHSCEWIPKNNSKEGNVCRKQFTATSLLEQQPRITSPTFCPKQHPCTFHHPSTLWCAFS